MTGQADANRTFRSIFGDKEKRHDQVLYLELEQSDNSASIVTDSGTGVAMNDDDDETMWNDEPLLDDAAIEQGKNELPGLQFAQRKSMEEWADDDEEEEKWKEALQDRVNQLELTFQHNDDSAVAQSRRQFEQQQVQQFPAHEIQGTDFSQSLPVSTRFADSDGDLDQPRQSSCHKMQRTSSLHACITGDDAFASSRQNYHWNLQHKVAGETAAPVLDQNRRMRSTSIEFVARNIQTVEHHRKRSGSLSGSASRMESSRHSLSRNNSFDNSRSSLSRSNSSSLRGTNAVPPADATSSFSSGSAVLDLSDTEAIRRFVLDDAKNMSIERLVSEAQRLYFLEDFYQTRQGLRPTPSVTTSTAASPPSLSSTSSAMSIS